MIIYTGFVYKTLLTFLLDHAVHSLLAETDLLVDGPFIVALKSLELEFRGSSNQRLLDREARRQIANILKNRDQDYLASNF